MDSYEWHEDRVVHQLPESNLSTGGAFYNTSETPDRMSALDGMASLAKSTQGVSYLGERDCFLFFLSFGLRSIVR